MECTKQAFDNLRVLTKQNATVKRTRKKMAKLTARKGRIFQNDEANPKNVTEPLDI
jgi:uncharacterized coiled-coil protein SlyX